MQDCEDLLCLRPDAEARSPSRELQILIQLVHYISTKPIQHTRHDLRSNFHSRSTSSFGNRHRLFNILSLSTHEAHRMTKTMIYKWREKANEDQS